MEGPCRVREAPEWMGGIFLGGQKVLGWRVPGGTMKTPGWMEGPRVDGGIHVGTEGPWGNSEPPSAWRVPG